MKEEKRRIMDYDSTMISALFIVINIEKICAAGIEGISVKKVRYKYLNANPKCGVRYFSLSTAFRLICT